MSSKGINPNKLVKSVESDQDALRELHINIIKQDTEEHKQHKASNKGFKLQKTKESQRMVTYEQNKVCLSYYFDKARVQPDMVRLLPLEI